LEIEQQIVKKNVFFSKASYLCSMANKISSVFIIDAGNTSIKVGVFQSADCKLVRRFSIDEKPEFDSFFKEHDSPPCFVSSVRNEKDDLSFFKGTNADFFNTDHKLPIEISYKTPETLGKDRLANAVAASQLSRGNKVVIDIGTCIKFDFIDENQVYHGGSISPGLKMRAEALHLLTGKLPKVEVKRLNNYLGTNTEESLQSGIIHGMQGEIIHFMNSYLQDYQGLTFFVTGGDAKFFDIPQKSNIFAHKNLTLEGLYFIYKLNA
jgi:type III pantothenate kinase